MISRDLSSCCAQNRFLGARVSRGDRLGGNSNNIAKRCWCFGSEKMRNGSRIRDIRYR